jgi:hypothetical protein
MAKSAGGGGRTGGTDVVARAMRKRYGTDNVLSAKGGGFYVRGQGRVSLAQARKVTNIKAPKITR